MFLMCSCGFACASETASGLHFPRYPLHRAGANAAFPSNRQHAFARKMALDSFQRRVKPIQKTRRKRCRRSAGSNILFPCPESSALSIRCGVLLGTHGCALNVCGLTQKAFEQVAKCLDPLVGRRLRAVEIEDIETLETIVQADTRDVEATAVEVRVEGSGWSTWKDSHCRFCGRFTVQADIQIFGLERPLLSEGVFKPTAQCPPSGAVAP
jgi:hypothetical protein